MLSTGALRIHDHDGTTLLDRTPLFDSNAPREPAHISLTASARFAQRTGVYVAVLVAFALAGPLTPLTRSLITPGRHFLISLDDVCYTVD